MIILGAGISGLLAGCVFQRATLYEAGPEAQAQHKALLRFRSSAVGDAVGIDFRRVNVKKGIWHDGAFVAPTIQLANWYALKVIGKLADRSIWDIEPCERYVAPDDFIGQLVERCSGRINWSTPVGAQDIKSFCAPIISTIPLPAMLAMALPHLHVVDFNYDGISVVRWLVSGADVHQTIYFPSPATRLYRASITGNTLIAEYRGQPDDYDLFTPFGILPSDCDKLESTSQRYGKIAPINDAIRKQLIWRLTNDHNVFSLGRFATWRNILLDDVLRDISVLKKLMAASHYDRSRANA